jgi:hypothetical protein
MSQEITHSCVIERKQPHLPRFVVIPSRLVAAWRLPGTAAVEGKLDVTELGRRTIKSWDKDRWFIEIPEPLCRRAQVDTGSRVMLTLRLASTDLPDELSSLCPAIPPRRLFGTHLPRVSREY